MQYVHVLEEVIAALNHTVLQLQTQQEDLEKRECCQYLWIRGVPETIIEKGICPYLLGLFNTLVHIIPDID